MSRIIAGKWKGHPLPILKHGPVRPTASRTRTVLYDTLRDVSGMTVLDLFSGCGSLGLEALSRGAGSLTSVDQQFTYIQMQKTWLKQHPGNYDYAGYSITISQYFSHHTEKFDLILIDPPYDFQLTGNQWCTLRGRLNPEGLLVYELANRLAFEMPLAADLQLYKAKRMGDTALHFYGQREG